MQRMGLPVSPAILAPLSCRTTTYRAALLAAARMRACSAVPASLASGSVCGCSCCVREPALAACELVCLDQAR